MVRDEPPKAVFHKDSRTDPYFSTMALVTQAYDWLAENNCRDDLINWYDNQDHVIFQLRNEATALLLKLSLQR